MMAWNAIQRVWSDSTILPNTNLVNFVPSYPSSHTIHYSPTYSSLTYSSSHQSLLSSPRPLGDHSTTHYIYPHLNHYIIHYSTDMADKLKDLTQKLTKDYIKLSKPHINLLKYPLFAGSSKETSLTLNINQSYKQENPSDYHILKVWAECHEKVKDPATVFTIKTPQMADFTTTIEYPVKIGDEITIKIKALMPELQDSMEINGSLKIQVDTMKPHTVSINSKCEVPHIICLKDLLDVSTGNDIIKIPIKKNVPPIPFKNCSNINFPFQIKLLSKEDFSKRSCDLVAPQIINVSANQPFFLNLQLKVNPNIKQRPKIDIIRKILVLQVQGSRLFFSYLLQAIVYDNDTDVNTTL